MNHSTASTSSFAHTDWRHVPAGSPPRRWYDYITEESWLAQRSIFIGASETPAILGYGFSGHNRCTVWANKTGRGEPMEDSDALLCGRMLQEGIGRIFAKQSGQAVEHPGDFTVFYHPEWDFIGATLDMVTYDPEFQAWGPLEIKNVDAHMLHEWAKHDEPPLRVNIQVQQQMACFGSPFAWVCGLVGGNKPIRRRVEFDPTFWAMVEARLGDFWKYVLDDVPPPIDGSFASEVFLKWMHPDDNGLAVRLPEELEDVAERLEKAKAAIKEAGEAELECKNIIRSAMGDNTYGVLPSGRCYSWKTAEKRSYAVKASKSRTFREVKLPENVEFAE